MVAADAAAPAEAEEGATRATAAPPPREIYRVIREEGEAELDRHSGATAWSGLAAGLSMGFSFLVMAIIQSHLADAPWRVLVSSFGYGTGFLIVVLGRQQLFTESTLTAVLPVLSAPSAGRLRRLMVYWAVVLSANLAGTVIFAWAICHRSLFPEATWQALCAIAVAATDDAFWPTLVKAILAGWLIALMIWLLPGAGPARVVIILVLTYVVAVSHFSHTIAGSVETAFAVFAGQTPPLDYLTRFFVPTLIGNTIGGILLVALLNHAPLAAES